MYQPDIYGATPPQFIWPLYNALASRWQLDDSTREKVLGPEPSLLNPDQHKPERVELAKDIELHLAISIVPKLDHTEWLHRSMPVFSELSPLQVMGATPQQLFNAIDQNGKNGWLANYGLWRGDAAQASPTLGLELVRGLAHGLSSAESLAGSAIPKQLLARLINDGRKAPTA